VGGTVTFAESVQTCFKKYADFDGRGSRSEYWWFYLLITVVNLALYLTWVSSVSDPYSDGLPPGLIFSLIFSLAVILPTLAAAVRRLHDTGKSGASIFISLIPLIGGLILIVWLATDGTQGANQYGERPTK
jgi:uncharacterized membrane protein YhaH (DUF805 family)